MRTEISRLHHQLQTTMIYVTHDQIEAMSMGTRIVVLRDGIVQQVDTPLNIYHHPANKFVAGFIGSPTMNFLQGTVKQNGAWIFNQDGTSVAVALPTIHDQKLKRLQDNRVVLGIRPEHIHLHQPAGVDSVAPVEAHVEVVEPVGNEIFVYFTTGASSQYVARFATDAPPQVGKGTTLLLDTSKVHFFDTSTDAALT
jgi:multiple sugar transport system ATP-binding protein